MTKRPHQPAAATIHAASPRRTLARRGPAPLVLEQRIMFDAAGAESAVRHAAEHVMADAPVDTHAAKAESYVPAAVAAPASQAASESQRTEIVFIEDNVNNVAQLVAGVRAGVEVVMLDHTRDGLQQMLDVLAAHAPVDAIHLVSHGATGQLSLGTQSLSVDNIESASAELAQLGHSLNAGGDLLLYGCDVAQGTTGAGFVERMAALTGADVAASIDVTGSRTFGGNWTLESHSGAIDTNALQLDRAGWEGELVNTVFDAGWKQLTFDNTGTNFSNIIGDGKANGNVVRFNNVITIGGQAIDAVVTTTIDRATISAYDSPNNPSTIGNAYFQPNMTITAAGGSASFKVDFYLAGSYSAAGTGTAVTLQHVVVNSYDIDGVGSGNTDRQFQVFKSFDRYELSDDTKLAASTLADGSVEFQYVSPSGVNNPSSTITADPYRVKVYYDSINSLVVKSGTSAAGSGTFSGIAYFALDFSAGADWSAGTSIVGTPAPKMSYSATAFAESAANDGAITATSTVTLANGSFTGTDNAALSGVSFSNLPAGLSAIVTRTSATTALLSFSGSALAHANANDVNNFGVNFGDSAFVSNKASAVTGANRADLVLDFADPAPDTVAPVVAARSDSYAENRSAGAVVSTVAATDAVGVTGFRFAQTGTSTSADGYFAIGANGAITLTASGAAAGSSANDYELTPHTFVMGVQARDAAANWSSAQNVTLTVTNVDDAAPDFTSASTGHAVENQAILTTAVASDNVDFTDHRVSFTLAAGGDAASLAIDASTGVVRLATGALDFETKSIYTFTVRAQDASGNTHSQQVTVSVDNVDEVAPAFTSAAGASVLENQNVLYQAHATDLADFTDHIVSYNLQAGGDAALLAIDGASGVVTLAQGNLDFETRASYTFTVRAQDASGNVRNQAVTVTVLDADEVAPMLTITSSQAALKAGDTSTLVFAFSEDIGASFSAADITLQSGSIGALTRIDATHYSTIYTPDAANAGGTVVISVAAGRVQDLAGNANSAGASLSLAVDTVAPAIIGPATIALPENTTAVRQFTASETVNWSLAGGEDAARFTIAADGTLAFSSAPDFEHPTDGATAGSNTYSVNVRAIDAAGNATVHALTVTVLDVNEAPVAAPVRIAATEDTPVSGQLPVALDADGDSVSYALNAPAAHGVADVHADGSYTYTPAANFHGIDAFSYTVSDGRGGSNTYVASITVGAINDAPVAANATASTDEDTSLTGMLPVVTDVDGDSVAYALGSGAQHGNVLVNADGSYLYTPTSNFNGSDSFSYSVNDGHGGSNTYSVAITVRPVNDVPVAGPATIATQEDTPVSGMLPAALDIDGDSVAYVLGTAPQHGAVALQADGSYTYTPVADYHGVDAFSYTVSDGHGGSATYAATITVGAVNDAPVAADSTASTREDTALVGTLPVATDADGDDVGYALGRGPQHGAVTVNADGSYRYTPATNFNGSDSFTYSVNDGHGGSNTYTVSLTVAPVNDAPVASSPNAGSATVGETMAPVSIKPFTDIDSAALTYSATRADGTPLPAWLTFDANTLTFTGTPPAGAAGTLSLTVRGSDGALSAATGVTLAIRDAVVPAQTVAIGQMSKDSGSSATDFLTADGSANRTVSGTLSAPLGANEVLRVSFDGGASFTAAAVTGNSWTAADTRAHNADWTIVAQVANSVTGSAGAQASQRAVLDAAAPGQATVQAITSISTTPVISGSAALAPGETLSVTVDGKSYDVTPQNGTWSLTLSAPLAAGHNYDVTTTVRDSAGNTAVNASSNAVAIIAPVPAKVAPSQDTVVAPLASSAATVPMADSAVAQAVPVNLPVAPARPELIVPGGSASNDARLVDQASSASGRTTAPGLAGVTSIAGLRQAAELSDVYTRTEGFRTVVAKADEPALVLFQGVPDQFIDAGNGMALTVPSDAFAHTQPKAIVQLAATLQDGSPLPSWVAFSSQSGQFSGQPPAGLSGELRIKLTARDMDGREATALFRVNVGQAKTVPGKSGLGEQLRQSGAVRGTLRAGGGRG